ncbi:MAG: hypothetical protein RB191_10470 [Terriglobia bacterium]|nr:hypothetical protein [Terriglobia bacterium]
MMLSDIFLTRFLTDVVHLNHPETSQRRFAPTPDHFTGISGPLHWNTHQSTDEDFYELCDKYGILVWDEFFQPNPSDGPNPDDLKIYLANVKDKILLRRPEYEQIKENFASSVMRWRAAAFYGV